MNPDAAVKTVLPHATNINNNPDYKNLSVSDYSYYLDVGYRCHANVQQKTYRLDKNMFI